MSQEVISLQGHDQKRILQTAGKVVRKAVEMFGGRQGWEGRTGCQLFFTHGATGAPLFTSLIGEMNDAGRLARCFDFAGEKASRLAINANDGHRTSAESANPDQQKYGGAVLSDPDTDGKRFICSVSGFPEADIRQGGDTAVAMTVLVMTGYLDIENARETAGHIGNELFLPLFEACTGGNENRQQSFLT